MSAPQKKSYTVSKLKGWPIIGMLLPAIKTPLHFVMDVSQRCGDIISFHVMGQKIVQLNHPDLIRYVLLENHKNYKKSKLYVRFESALGLGLLTSNGEKWKRDRQKIQPLFNRSRISEYHFEIVNEVSEKYKQKWLALTDSNGKAEINITKEMANITTEVILKSIFGKSINDEVVAALHHSADVLVEYLKNIRVFYNIDLRKLFCFPSYFRFKKELDNVDNQIKVLAKQYRSGATADKYNMLALLIEAQKEDPEHFSEQDIKDHCTTMVFAGFETTSILLQWLWYVLDEQPEATEKLRDNITRNAPCTATLDSSNLTFESVRQMDYLSAVLKETMRLYPSFWVTSREAIEDDYFGEFKVKRGSWIVVPQLAMHRHPKWWNEPNEFIPERFFPENEANIDEGAYFPFSQGPRKCSGYSFAEMEAKTVMAKLLPLFTVAAVNKSGNAMYGGVSLKLEHSLIAEISRHETNPPKFQATA